MKDTVGKKSEWKNDSYHSRVYMVRKYSLFWGNYGKMLFVTCDIVVHWKEWEFIVKEIVL